nr:MAG TPA: hypothetical protein [Caudoviricetes sp.]
MQQGWLRDTHTGLIAAIAKALLTEHTVMWFQGEHVLVDDGSRVFRYDVPLGIHTNKRKLTFRPGPLIRFTNKGVEVLGTLCRYRKPWRECAEAVPYTPTPVETPYGVAPRVQLFAETLAKLGGRDAKIHDLVDKRHYESKSLMEAANLDQVVGGLNEKILVAHDDRCIERMRREVLPEHRAEIK